MARIYSGIWEQGKFEDLTPNYHYHKTAGSLIVPAGEVVIIYKNNDRQGGKSYPYYEGTYHHLAWYGTEYKPGVIHVEKTEIRHRDLVEIGYYTSFKDDKGKDNPFYMHLKVPIGEWSAPDHFWNDRITHLQIPFGVTVEVFDQANKQGGSLIFSGDVEDGRAHVGLPDHNYGHKVSSMKITADGWISAGIMLENEEFIDGGEWEAETGHVDNNSKTATVTLPISIATTVEDTKEIAWDIRAGVSAKAEFEFGPETAHGTVGVEVSVEGGYGENESNTNSREVSRGIEVEVPPDSRADATLMVRQGKMTADIVRTWRNKRTGAMTETRGKVTIEKSGETRIRVD